MTDEREARPSYNGAMSNALPETMTTAITPAPAGWAVAGTFMEALTHRDFDAMSGCLDPQVRLRALVPRGLLELHGPEVIARLRTWFGGDDDFEVVDAALGEAGSRLYMRWRVRMSPATARARVVEQHVYAGVGARVETIDLLCSGFADERPRDRRQHTP
jgi:hypothetical protein